MITKNYELLEHTADIGIRVKGSGLEEIFVRSAAAIFDIIAQKKGFSFGGREKVKIEQAAGDLQELFVNWLNELLSLAATRRIIFYKFIIERLTDNGIIATAIGKGFKHYKINIEIKAATYHQLKIEKNASGWQAEVILDV